MPESARFQKWSYAMRKNVDTMVDVVLKMLSFKVEEILNFAGGDYKV